MYHYNQKGLQTLQNYILERKPSKVIVLTDYHTKELCLPKLLPYLPAHFVNINIPPGESYKQIETLQSIWKQLLENNADRNSLMINLGGGVITDIGGFAASTFKRGIDFIHIPTTLLSMVDAAIGGKNGINFLQGKNQIGNINLPKLILVNDDFLNTLPQMQIDSGIAEMLKHGLIGDRDYWQKMVTYLNNKNTNFSQLIKESIQIKNEIINEDPYEKGLRKVLNFGHTLGHAIESYLNYQKKSPITHGHAVAMGMILSVYISNKIKILKFTLVTSIISVIRKQFTLIPFTDQDILYILELLSFDKKNINGIPQFILLEDIGIPAIDQAVSKEIIIESFKAYNALATKRSDK